MSSTCLPEELLAQAGLAFSDHRCLVLETIHAAKKAISSKEILLRARKRNTVDKVTVYRILDLLVDKKLVRRISALDGVLRYEVVCAAHHPEHGHFECRDCGEIECLAGINWDRVKREVMALGRFGLQSVGIKVEGVCLKCQKRSR